MPLCSPLRAAVLALILAAVPVSAHARTAPPGTSITATVSAGGRLTTSFGWTISKSADPTSQMVAVGSNATVQWTISVTRDSGSGTRGAALNGQVCVTNQGSVTTQGLAIGIAVAKPPNPNILNTGTVDVSAQPQLLPGQSACYPYQLTIPAAAIVPGATYKVTARVTITDQSGSPGIPSGPSPSATANLPTTPTPLGISVSDTNGQSFSFSDTGSQSYDQDYSCPQAVGPQTLTETNTATIESTGQQAQGTATIHCSAATTTTTTLSATSIQSGGSASDQASISGLQSGAGGTIDYAVYDNSSCSGTPYADATPASNTVTSSSVPASTSVSFPDAGTYYWQATYSGDAGHNTMGSQSTCAEETLTVTASSGCTSDGTIGCPWQAGDVTTYSQPEWGAGGSANALLLADFNTVYPGASVLEIGLPNTGYVADWSDPTILSSYLPASGPPAALNANVLNPTTTPSGLFGGDVAALKLNVDFSDTGLITGNAKLKFGDLTICGLTGDTDLNGMTVRDFLTVANTALGAGATTDSISDIDSVAADLDFAFDGSTPTAWAQQHLEDGTCGWHGGDLTTYDQAEWGGTASPATLLLNNYNSVYTSVSLLFVIGDPSGYIEEFDGADALHTYLPQSGTVGVLNATLLDPTSSSAGALGGDVAALKLNIDFSDAGLLSSNNGLKVGDLTICGLTSDTGLNGSTVRGFLTTANSVLGTASTAFAAADLDTLAQDLDASFDDGTPSSFAQDHLVDGSCP